MKPTRIHSLPESNALAVVRRLAVAARYEPSTGCIVWAAARDRHGYGRMNALGIDTGAHRLAWLAIMGDIPGDLVVDHLCRNRACVNPAHMELVTNRENGLRGDFTPKAGRRRGRPRGEIRGCGKHGYSDGYERLMKDGYRRWVCRTCARTNRLAWVARQALAA